MKSKTTFLKILLSATNICFGAGMTNLQGPLNLSGSQYWNNPLDHAGDAGMERLRNDKAGMVIDVPPKVYLDERKTIPLICLWTQDKEKARRISLVSTTWLILAHLETDDIQVVKLARSPDVPDDGPVSKGWINEWHEADISEVAHLGPALGRYSAWLVCGTYASNIRDFMLYPSRKAELDGDVQARLKELRKSAAESESSLDEGKYSVKSEKAASSGLKTDGISLSLGSGNIGHVEIKVRFRFAGLEKHLHPGPDFKKDAAGRTVFASFPILLIGFSQEHGFTFQRNVQIPVYEKPSGTFESPTLDGSVTILLPKDGEFDTKKVKSLWAATMNIRSMIELPK